MPPPSHAATKHESWRSVNRPAGSFIVVSDDS
jgi:hypothetical protein